MENPLYLGAQKDAFVFFNAFFRDCLNLYHCLLLGVGCKCDVIKREQRDISRTIRVQKHWDINLTVFLRSLTTTVKVSTNFWQKQSFKMAVRLYALEENQYCFFFLKFLWTNSILFITYYLNNDLIVFKGSFSLPPWQCWPLWTSSLRMAITFGER